MFTHYSASINVFFIEYRMFYDASGYSSHCDEADAADQVPIVLEYVEKLLLSLSQLNSFNFTIENIPS